MSTKRKPLEELTIVDDYMFGAVMQDPDICKSLLEAVMGKKIRKIEYVDLQNVIQPGYNMKGVRLDVFVEGDDEVYNVEMQTSDQYDLGKRMRYYQAAIDTQVFQRGQDYNELKTTYIIFFCTFDPFKKGRCVYTIKPVCTEDHAVKSDDGTTRIVINIRGDKQALSTELAELLNYMDAGIVSGKFTQQLDTTVTNVKRSEKWRHDYMLWVAREAEIRKEGREEGRIEAETLLSRIWSALQAQNRTDEFGKVLSDMNYRAALCKELHIEVQQN